MSEHDPLLSPTPGPITAGLVGNRWKLLSMGVLGGSGSTKNAATRWYMADVLGTPSGSAKQDAEELARRWNSHNALVAACERLLRSFESDSERAPTLDILTCWQTNSQAVAEARAAIALAKKGNA